MTAHAEQLSAILELDQKADALLEEAVQRRLSLERTLQLLFPLLAEHVGARAGFVRSYDEELQQRDFSWSEGSSRGLPVEEIERICELVEGVEAAAEGSLIAQKLDVAGEPFGTAGILLTDDPADEEARTKQVELFRVWCEELDNFLASVALARRKHQATRAIANALSALVLDDGIKQAVTALAEVVRFEDFLLVYHDDEDVEGRNLNYKLFRNGELKIDSSAAEDPAMRQWAKQLLAGDVDQVAGQLGLERFREEALVNGVKHRRLVGRVVISRDEADGEFNTFDRDLLERFADHLRQRIVDFNREWKQLSLCFSPPVVRRLLAHENYARRLLVPQERDAAVMYCDISGFTRISEQILREPALIGKLIDTWSARVVEIVWESDGVFDKMVGDCVIAMWGPPLFDISGREACLRAAAAARKVRDFTRSLSNHPQLPQLRGIEPPIGVATGLNYCTLFVGRIGPNDDYTGFSSGMNNTARLQGLAERDEILCMESFVETISDVELFGEQRHGRVKNVEQPLAFRALR